MDLLRKLKADREVVDFFKTLGGIDLSEREEKPKTLREKYAILNRQMARSRGLYTRRMRYRMMAVPGSMKKARDRAEAAAR